MIHAITERLSLLWCSVAHSTEDLRFIVHQRLGIVAVCARCRKVHLP